jgi:hypothetical protein
MKVVGPLPEREGDMRLLALPFVFVLWLIAAPFRLTGWVLSAPFRLIGWMASAGSAKHAGPATILRIWFDPPAGAPTSHWTYVLFESGGRRFKVHLSRSQADPFVDRYVEGDDGYLECRGQRLISWTPR